MTMVKRPKFYAGKNIAIKVPPHKFSEAVEFYRDTLGLSVIDEGESGVVFDFGGKRLWVDKAYGLSRAEIWLEIQSDDVEEARSYLGSMGVTLRDEIEKLPVGFEGFWIASPADIIHLVSRG